MRDSPECSATRALLTAALVAALAPPVSPAEAQSYPSRPVHVILPFAGSTDTVARLLASKLSPALGQQLVPDPRLGAGGNIAHRAAAEAAPDGYTLLMAAPPLVINPNLNPKAGYDPLRDFSAVALLSSIPNVLVVHPRIAAASLAELVQLARGAPGKLTYGSGGVGSTNHLAAELLKSMTRTDILHVPYKSATVALTGLLGGEIDIVIVAASSAAPYVKDGRLRALAVLDAKRSSAMPDVPTSAEARMPQLLAVNWSVLLAPAGTPRAIIEKLNAEAVKAMNAPDLRERLAAIGSEPGSGSPEDTAAFLRRESEQWGKVIREAGIKAE